MIRLLGILIMVFSLGTANAASWKTQKSEDTNINGGEIIYIENESATDNSWIKLSTIKNWVLLDTPTVPTLLADLSGDSTHRLVTDAQISTWNSGIGSSTIEGVTGLTAALDTKVNIADVKDMAFSSDFTKSSAGNVDTISLNVKNLAFNPTNFSSSTVGNTTTISTTGSAGASKFADLTDIGNVSVTELGFIDGARDNIQNQIDGISVGSPVVTAPTYKDSACTKGQYAYSANGLTKYECVASNTWFTSALSDTLSLAPVTYSLGFTLSGVSGADKLTINGTDYTAGTTITGLSGDVAVTGTLGSSTALACTGTGISGTGLSYLASMTAARSMACVFSTSVTPSFYLSGDTLNATTPDIGSTLVANTGFTQTAGHTGNAYETSTPTDSFLKVALADVDISVGSIDFWYRPDYSGTPSASQELISSNSAGFSLTHTNTGDLQFSYVNKTPKIVGWSPVSGQWYHMILRWNNHTGVFTLSVDGTVYDTTIAAQTTPALTVFGFGRQYQTDCDFAIDEIKIYKTVLP